MVILAKMKQQFCGRRAILERDVQPLEREELDPYGLKLPQFHWHKVDVSKLVMSARGAGERPHTTDGHLAYE